MYSDSVFFTTIAPIPRSARNNDIMHKTELYSRATTLQTKQNFLEEIWEKPDSTMSPQAYVELRNKKKWSRMMVFYS